MDCRTFVVFVFLVIVNCSSCRGTLNFSNFHDIFNLTVIRQNLSRIYNDFEVKINKTYSFLSNNWMLDPVCANELEKCNATLSCCDEDLVCYKTVNSSFHSCTNISYDRTGDSMEEDLDQHMNRLNDLAYDINYRNWANSFEFESRSTMRREEENAREENIWKRKHKNEIIEEHKWLPLLKGLIEKSKRKWNEIQKMKKLKEIKQILKEKISSRKHEDSLASNEEAVPEVLTEAPEPEETEQPKHKKQHNKHVKNSKKVEESKESRKKAYPGLDQLLRDADDVVKEHKAQEKEKFSSEERSSSEKQRSNEIAQIEDTEDKLEEELKRLKALQTEENKNKVVAGFEGAEKDEIKELIKKQVALILEQERKLSGLMKLNELKKMQENMKAQGIGNDAQVQAEV